MDSITRIDKKKYPIINGAYTLKGTETRQFLYNVWGDKRKLVLLPSQYKLLLRCDGSKSVGEILNLYSQQAHNRIIEYLSKLVQIGAITLLDIQAVRRLSIKLSKEPHLMSAHWEITRRCNSRCLHCYQKDYLESNMPDLNTKETFRVIDDLSELNVLKIGISGGEPLLRKDLFDILHYLESKEIFVSSILTNGILIGDSMLNKFLKLKSKLDCFISLDGASPDTAMNIRGFSGAESEKIFGRVIKNILLTIEAGFPVVINTVIHKDNIEQLLEMYYLIKTLGVSMWRIALGKEIGAYLNHSERFRLDWLKVFAAYLELIKVHLKDRREGNISDNFTLQIEHFFRLDIFPKLRVSDDSALICDYEGKPHACCIKPNGDVTPCALLLDYVAGNLKECNMQEIWYSEKLQNFKITKVSEVQECNGCIFVKICNTGCRANASFLNKRDLWAKDNLACTAVPFFLTKVKPYLETEGVQFQF